MELCLRQLATIGFILVCLLAPAQAAAPDESTSLTIVTENDFIRAVDDESKRAFAEIAAAANLGPPTRFEQMRVAALVKLEQFHVLKELFAKYGGKSAVLAFVATEIAVDFVAVPILLALKLPMLAMVLFAAPTAPAASGSVILWQRESLRRQMQVPSLGALDKIRTEMLEYSVNKRLFDVLIATADSSGDKELLLTIGKQHSGRKFDALVTSKELEATLNSSGVAGQDFLKHAQKLKAKPELYARVLLRFIRADSTRLNLFKNKFWNRFIQAAPSEAYLFLRQNEALQKDLQAKQHELSEAIKDAKRLRNSSANNNLAQELLTRYRQHQNSLTEIMFTAQKLDYGFLETIQLAERSSPYWKDNQEKLAQQISKESEEISVLLSVVKTADRPQIFRLLGQTADTSAKCDTFYSLTIGKWLTPDPK